MTDEFFFYCPHCGYYEKHDGLQEDIYTDVERHCGDCGKEMITRCPNELCTCQDITTLKNKFHPCGTELPYIQVAYERYIKPDIVRDVYGDL